MILHIVLFLSVLWPGLAWADQHFQILDELGDDEIEENTELYIDDVLVGRLHLDARTPRQVLSGTTTDAAQHQYRLCGKLIAQGMNGEVKSYAVDTSGELTDMDGRTYTAVTLDYIQFLLYDISRTKVPLPIKGHQGTGCTPVVS